MAILRFGHPSYFFFFIYSYFFFEEVVHKILRILTLYILRGKLGKVSTMMFIEMRTVTVTPPLPENCLRCEVLKLEHYDH